jgi:hypothetical protein
LEGAVAANGALPMLGSETAHDDQATEMGPLRHQTRQLQGDGSWVTRIGREAGMD